jgi:hypothetical protein
MSIGKGVAKGAASLRAGFSSTSEGQCVSVDLASGYAVVNVGGGAQNMPLVGLVPWPGDRVQVGYLGQSPVCLGPKPRAPIGTVLLVPADGVVTVLGDDGVTYVYPYDATRAYSTGQRVRLDHEGRAVGSTYGGEPVVGEFTPPGGAGGGGTQSKTFYPTDSGNYRNGSYSGQAAEVSDGRSAFYWYGAQIRDTIPDGAAISAASIRLTQEWDQVPGTASRMGTHGQGSRGGEPSLSGALSVPGGTRDLSIMAFADALKTGSALGVGLYKTFGWRRYGPASSSGQIIITWTN